MPKIVFIDHEGEQRSVDANVGDSVMDAATSNDVPGIDADCGGACACATCHVYVDEQWVNLVGAVKELESEMLEVAEGVEANSRLACQLSITEEMDGLVVITPESQY